MGPSIEIVQLVSQRNLQESTYQMTSKTANVIGYYRSTDPSSFYKEIFICDGMHYRVSFRDSQLFDQDELWYCTNKDQDCRAYEGPHSPFLFSNFVVVHEQTICRQHVFFDVVDSASKHHLVITLPDNTQVMLDEVEGFFSCHYQDGKRMLVGDEFFDGDALCIVTAVLGIDNRDLVAPDKASEFHCFELKYGFAYKNPRIAPKDYVSDEAFRDTTNADMVLFRRNIVQET